MLSVKGFRRQLQMFPETPSLEFFVNLLEKHWTRIRDLQIDMSPLVLESGRIWKALGRPATTADVFMLSATFIEWGSRPIVSTKLATQLPTVL